MLPDIAVGNDYCIKHMLRALETLDYIGMNSALLSFLTTD